MNKFFVFFCLLMLSLVFISGCGPNPGTDQLTGSTEWCKPGTQWAWTGTTDSGQASASWIMKGLEQFKGDTYCHVTLSSVEKEEGETVVEYYFKQTDGKTTDVWMIIKDSTGKTLNEMHVTGQS